MTVAPGVGGGEWPTTSLLVVQPTPFCNLNCTYCYLPNRQDHRVLAPDAVGVLINRVFRQFPTIGEKLTIAWHAGEPLVLGCKYYDDVFAIIEHCRPKSLYVEHAIQTNGTLLSKQWCDLFRRWNVGVGVSIDGPRHIHDSARLTRGGKGTFDKTVKGIECLKTNEIAFNVISVLRRQSVFVPDEMFDFYRRHDLRHVGFNIEEKEGANRGSTLDCGFDQAILCRFFERFVQLMQQCNFPMEIRELEHALLAIKFADANRPHNEQVVPFGIISIDVHGNLYTFSPELVGGKAETYRSFAIGNLFRDSFPDILASPNFRRLSAEIEHGTALCRANCAYFPVCGGGAPSNKLFENGSFASTETVFCRLTKQRIIDATLGMLEAMDPAQSVRPEDDLTRLSARVRSFDRTTDGRSGRLHTGARPVPSRRG